MRIPQTRYKIPDFFKDDNWHTINIPEEIPLSRKDPFAVYIGETTRIADRWGTCTKLKSDWLWRYNFPNASSGSTTYYSGSSSTGSNGSTYFNALGVGVSSSTWYDVGKDKNVVLEAYATSGATGQYKVSLTKIYFDYYYNINFNPSVTTPSTSANRGVVVKFKSAYSADLPSAIYTITDNVITWIDSPILRLLKGIVCTPY